MYRDHPTAFAQKTDAVSGTTNLSFSLGVIVSGGGVLEEVIWDSPAFEAGLTAGSEIVAVNGRAFCGTELLQAIRDATGGGALDLVVKNGKRLRTVSIPYAGGLRYPHLEPIDGARRRLDEILSPRRQE